MTESWDTVFAQRCAISLDASESEQWFMELRKTIPGWQHDYLLDGNDPLKGDKAKAINTEICTAIRWAMEQEKVPRADLDRRSAKYNLSDLIKWIRVWKSNARRYDNHRPMSNTDEWLISKYKPILRDWAYADRFHDIAFEIPMPLKIINEGENMPNMTLSPEGQKQLETWVLTELGIDCLKERQKWTKANYKRLTGKELDIGRINL